MIITVVRTDGFKRQLRKLPQDVQTFYEQQELILRENGRDPRLHTKKLKTLGGVYTFRITRRYRAFFYFHASTTVVIFEIDHRKDAY